MKIPRSEVREILDRHGLEVVETRVAITITDDGQWDPGTEQQSTTLVLKSPCYASYISALMDIYRSGVADDTMNFLYMQESQ